MEKPHHRRIQSFVRREGRITRGQQRALETLGPVYCLPDDKILDIDGIFGRHAPLSLEIGFGNGDALVHIATTQPDWNHIGIEVHRPGVGHLLQQLDKHALDNVRVYQADAVKVLNDCIPDNSLDRILLFFPDPWHKKRHHKRRIVQPDFIELAGRKLKPGGILHMATDWEEYAQHMLETLQASDRFTNCAGNNRYAEKPAYRPVTKFELRGQRLGHGVWDLVFERTKEQGR